MFYVYKLKKYGNYPDNWELSSRHESEADAVTAARKLCKSSEDIYTEPGNDLDAAYFSTPNRRNLWTAMIDTKDIHAHRPHQAKV